MAAYELLAFNRGLISRLGLARVDMKRVALAAEEMTNWMPRVLGSMMLRPGLGYIHQLSEASKLIPFIFSSTDTAIIAVRNGTTTFTISDTQLTRSSVTAAVSNSSFATATTGTVTMTIASPCVVSYTGTDHYANGGRVSFTTTGALPTGLTAGTIYFVVNVNTGANTFEVAATAGGASINTSGSQSGTHTATAHNVIPNWTNYNHGSIPNNSWAASGSAYLLGDGTVEAAIGQEVTVNEASTEHGLRIQVERGPVKLRVGSTLNGTDYINDYELDTGWHSLAITPTGSSFFIKLFNFNDRQAIVASCAVESSGAVSLGSPWGSSDLSLLRWDQSGDIIFVACKDKQQYKIMRRATRSWSIERYRSDDGPFRLENTSTITLTPSALTGNITLTSSAVSSSGIFRSGHVGGLFKISSVGQTVSDSFSTDNDFSTHIRVVGTGESRRFGVSITGTFAATVHLQRSVDEGSTWQDVTSWTTTTSTTHLDGLDDQIIWYRVGVKTGNYTSGPVSVSLVYSFGSITGIARVTAFTSSTVVEAEVLTAMGGTTASDVWSEGDWSDFRGWPSAVAFHDGRLFWAGKDKFWGSVTDQFYTFDPEFEGDAGPINRSIGYGPVDNIHWMLSLSRLLSGTATSEVSCMSSAFSEPLTPTNFTPKDSSTQGSALVRAVKVDNRGIFVQRNGISVYEVAYDVTAEDFLAEELTKIVPDIGSPGIVALGVQRKPDTRLHCVRSDGTVAVMVWDKIENVICWCDVETDGNVTDVCVLPGTTEDAVYYVVQREALSGAMAGTNYYLEKWALESEARGAAVTKLADSFVYAAGSSNVITGLTHLDGLEVVAWGGGAYLGTFTVSGGSITLHASANYKHRCAGLAYDATFKSSKLAYSMPGRSGLGLKKKVNHVGVVLADTHHDGLYMGPSFDTLDPLPATERYAEVAADSVWTEYDAQPIEFRGEWATDARVCLKASAPKACTVLAAVIELETNR